MGAWGGDSPMSNVQRKSMRSAEGEEKPPDTLDSIDILNSTDNLPIPYNL